MHTLSPTHGAPFAQICVVIRLIHAINRPVKLDYSYSFVLSPFLMLLHSDCRMHKV